MEKGVGVQELQRDIIDISPEAILAQKGPESVLISLKCSQTQLCPGLSATCKPGPGAGMTSVLKTPRPGPSFYRQHLRPRKGQ